jgi:methionyl-tRNA synthetase
VSKSEGTAVSLDLAVARHGADSLRWFLMREVGFESDGDFTWDRFDARYNADLADGIGNLASRVTAMLVKYRDGAVPHAPGDTPLDLAGRAIVAEYVAAMSALDLKRAAAAIERLVAESDGYVTTSAPWALAKAGDDAALDATLATLIRSLMRLTLMAAPIMPGKARDLWAALGHTEDPDGHWNLAEHPDAGGKVVRKPENLFPKG